MQYVTEQIRRLSYSKLRMVIGMVEDKDTATVLSLLPEDAAYYFCRPSVTRGMDAKKLASDASFWNLRGSVFNNVPAALDRARMEANEQDLIFVGGSTFVVAEVL